MFNKTPPARIAQEGRLFRVYNHYRVVVSIMLVGLLFLDVDILAMQYLNLTLYQGAALAYLALNSFIAFMLMAGFRASSRHITLSMLVDILVLHVLVLLGGGIGSGIINLVIIAVAAGNILKPSRLGIFYAALATLFSLAVASWSTWVGIEGLDSVVRAGFLGAIYFGAAIILQNITRRLVSSEALAQERAKSIAQLEQLNHQIIQRMRTGILVSDRNGNVRLANAAAGELLAGKAESSNRLNTLPLPLQLRQEQWLQQPGKRTDPFQATDTTPQVQANFTQLDDDMSDHILIFLEDTSKVMQQAQQMKLASLGRLTAGIAHEIRNPLGAISHAAQLLAESDRIAPADLKMTDIIQRHSHRVNAIVENVLELSRRKAANMQELIVDEWLPGVIADYRECCDMNCRIELEVESSPAHARFDPSQMTQVLTNLMDNGLRYSEKQTGQASVVLRCGVTTDQQRAYIDVIDQGPGLDEGQRTSVFDPFFTTEKGGTGLGLYLARELCEANQAQLTLLDPQAGQCAFRITFAHPYQRSADYFGALPDDKARELY